MGLRLCIFAVCAASSLFGCCKDKPAEALDDRELSTLAQRVNAQLASATDPYHPNDRDAATLARSMAGLYERRDALRADIASARDASDVTAQRIRLIRVERQIEMIDRLLSRYEQNASVMAQRD